MAHVDPEQGEGWVDICYSDSYPHAWEFATEPNITQFCWAVFQFSGVWNRT